MHATSRSVVTAARTHPAGIAAPSAVIVTAIILFTLVTSVIAPAIPPGLFGIGSAPTIAPSPDQPRHRVQARPVPTGPPVLPGLTSGIGANVPSPSGGNVPAPSGGGAPNPPGGGQPPVSPVPLPVTGFPPGTIPVTGVSPHLPPSSARGCPACYAGRVPGSAAVTVVTGAGNALHTVTQAVTSGSVIPEATSGLAAVTGSALQAAGALASSVASAVPATVAAPLRDLGSVVAQAAPAVTATVVGAGDALQATAQAVTSGRAVPAVTSELATASGSAIQAVATGSVVQAAGAVVASAPVKAVAATTAAAGHTVQSTVQVAAGSGGGGLSQATAQSGATAQERATAQSQATTGGQVSSGGAGGAVVGAVVVEATRSGERSVEVALPGAGSLPGVG
jgi:hypothetical protein